MAKPSEPGTAPATAKEKESGGEPERPSQDQPAENQPSKDKPAEVKKGVLDERDLRSGHKLYKIQIDKLRGDVQGVRFNDDCIAEGLTAEQVQDLAEFFGAKNIKVLDATEGEDEE
jgi:hypothetical protein